MSIIMMPDDEHEFAGFRPTHQKNQISLDLALIQGIRDEKINFMID